MNETHDNETSDERPEGPESEGRLTPAQVIASTLAAAFGVQSSRNRNRDFSRGRASQFIVAGIVFTALFVLVMVVVVNLVLGAAS